MSNHSGSYMLNEVIEIFDKAVVFDLMGREKTQDTLSIIVNLATRKYDCNQGEILENHASKFGICYVCLTPAEDIEDDLCLKCRQ